MVLKSNSVKSFNNYKKLAKSSDYVDRTQIIEHLNAIKATDNKYLCVVSNDVVGKTSMCDMIYSYYCDRLDAKELFEHSDVAKSNLYIDNINKHKVLYLDMIPEHLKGRSFESFICSVEEAAIKQLKLEFPNVKISMNNTLRNNLNKVYERTGKKFIILIDDWDFIIYNDYYGEEFDNDYFKFLMEIFSDAEYTEAVYVTGYKGFSDYTSIAKFDVFNEFDLEPF